MQMCACFRLVQGMSDRRDGSAHHVGTLARDFCICGGASPLLHRPNECCEPCHNGQVIIPFSTFFFPSFFALLHPLCDKANPATTFLFFFPSWEAPVESLKTHRAQRSNTATIGARRLQPFPAVPQVQTPAYLDHNVQESVPYSARSRSLFPTYPCRIL